MTDSNDVGYGKPPRSTQFKPGQSGNPKGRPRGTRNLSTDLKDELKTLVNVREGGKEKKVSKQQAMIMGVLAKAMGGDIKAANTVIELLLRLHEHEQDHAEAEPLSPEELELLRGLGERYNMNQPDQGDGEDKGAEP